MTNIPDPTKRIRDFCFQRRFHQVSIDKKKLETALVSFHLDFPAQSYVQIQTFTYNVIDRCEGLKVSPEFQGVFQIK
jgi:hypothetical protein